MAAVIDIRTAAELDRPVRSVSDVPRLRVIQGGRSARALRMRRVFLVRRLAVATLAVLVLLALMGAVSAAWASASGPSSVAGAVTGTAQVHVVAPGDTLWGIATAHRPESDPRDVVRALISANPDVPGVAQGRLSVGQQLSLPGA